jgi:hypothetical protein
VTTARRRRDHEVGRFTAGTVDRLTGTLVYVAVDWDSFNDLPGLFG